MIVRNKCHRFRRAVRSSRSNKDRGAYVYVQKRLIKEGALVVITGFPIKSSTARIHQICRIRITISISLARPFTSRSSMRRDGRDRRRFSTSSLFLSPTLSLSLSLSLFPNKRLNFDCSERSITYRARDTAELPIKIRREPRPRASSWNSKSKVPPCRVHRTDGRKDH